MLKLDIGLHFINGKSKWIKANGVTLEHNTKGTALIFSMSDCEDLVVRMAEIKGMTILPVQISDEENKKQDDSWARGIDPNMYTMH